MAPGGREAMGMGMHDEAVRFVSDDTGSVSPSIQDPAGLGHIMAGNQSDCDTVTDEAARARLASLPVCLWGARRRRPTSRGAEDTQPRPL